MCTNKVYGDAPNELPLDELATRWEYADRRYDGIAGDVPHRPDQALALRRHKVAADIMVQEYGRYFDMRPAAFAAAASPGPNHSGVELHGFLSYLIKCNLEGRSTTSSATRANRCATTSTRSTSPASSHAFIDCPARRRGL